MLFGSHPFCAKLRGCNIGVEERHAEGSKVKTRLDGHLHRSCTGGQAIKNKDNLQTTSSMDAEFAGDLSVFAASSTAPAKMVKSIYFKFKTWGFRVRENRIYQCITFGRQAQEIDVGPFVIREADDTAIG